MQVQYNNKLAERQCTDLKQAKRDFSEKVAKKLHMMINFIESADNLLSVRSFPRYRFHSLNGNRKGQYALDIDGKNSPYRLIVCFDEENDSNVFSEPTSIKVIQVEEVSKHYE